MAPIFFLTFFDYDCKMKFGSLGKLKRTDSLPIKINLLYGGEKMAVFVKNIMEKLVIDKLDQMMPSLGCCPCDICKTDILCYALNRIKPKYVSTEQGELLSRVDSISVSYGAAIMTELVAGAEIVRKNPRHKV